MARLPGAQPAPVEKDRSRPAQWWFLFEHRAEAELPYLAKAATKEFRAGKWVSFDEAVSRAVEFKRPIYEELRAEFG